MYKQRTIREAAEDLVTIGTGLSAAHPVGSKIVDRARYILRMLDEAPEYIDAGQPDMKLRFVCDDITR